MNEPKPKKKSPFNLTLPKWVDDWKPEALGLSVVFSRKVDLTETPPEPIDNNYYAIHLRIVDENTIECVKMHSLTLHDVIRFKKSNPDKYFVMDYDEKSKTVKVM